MTKADELWEKHKETFYGGDPLGRDAEDGIKEKQFLAALKEYGELVKAGAVKVCYDADKSTHPSDLAAAIKDMELPGFEKQVDPNKWAFDRGLESF